MLAALAVLALPLAGCTDHKKDPNAAKQEKVLQVGVDADGNGACLMVEEDLGKEVEKLPVVPCTAKHNFEVFAKVPYSAAAPGATAASDESDATDETTTTVPADLFPGLQELGKFAERICLVEFEKYVGISQFDSKLHYSWLLPTLDSWNNDDDTNVLCVLTDPNSEFLDGSMRNKKI